MSIADDIVSGFFCTQCNCMVDGQSPGYPRRCEDCGGADVLQDCDDDYVCGACGKTFGSEHAVNQHIKAKHGEES